MDTTPLSNMTCASPPINIDCGFRRCAHGTCNEEPSDGFIPLYTCSCNQGWIGDNCDKCCPLPCVEGQGKCDIDYDAQQQYCACSINYRGEFCEEFYNSSLPQTERVHVNTSTKDVQWEIPVIVATVVVFVLATSVVIILYRLVHTRHPWMIKFLLKWNNWTIDDSNKKYDAFISYRTSHDEDRDFVRDQMLPYFENEGYTVCIDERDLLPGKSITDNLGQAIHDSKRTILIISPAFVEGKWPEFEVQCALIEWLDKSQRVIPIIYKPIDDVKDKISPSLNHILKSITYLEWPQDGEDKENEFWRRLLLALPKKVEKDDISAHSGSELLDQHLVNSNKEMHTEINEQKPGMDNLVLQLEKQLDKPIDTNTKYNNEFIV